MTDIIERLDAAIAAPEFAVVREVLGRAKSEILKSRKNTIGLRQQISNLNAARKNRLAKFVARAKQTFVEAEHGGRDLAQVHALEAKVVAQRAEINKLLGKGPKTAAAILAMEPMPFEKILEAAARTLMQPEVFDSLVVAGSRRWPKVKGDAQQRRRARADVILREALRSLTRKAPFGDTASISRWSKLIKDGIMKHSYWANKFTGKEDQTLGDQQANMLAEVAKYESAGGPGADKLDEFPPMAGEDDDPDFAEVPPASGAGSAFEDHRSNRVQELFRDVMNTAIAEGRGLTPDELIVGLSPLSSREAKDWVINHRRGRIMNEVAIIHGLPPTTPITIIPLDQLARWAGAMRDWSQFGIDAQQEIAALIAPYQMVKGG